MTYSKQRNNFLIAIIILLCANICYAKDYLFLQCIGRRFIEIDLITSQKEKVYRSYEIKNGNLVIRTQGRVKNFEPSEYNDNIIRYFISDDLGHLMKNYHLQFDRISGRFAEQYDTYPSKGYWKLEGICEITIPKF